MYGGRAAKGWLGAIEQGNRRVDRVQLPGETGQNAKSDRGGGLLKRGRRESGETNWRGIWRRKREEVQRGLRRKDAVGPYGTESIETERQPASEKEARNKQIDGRRDAWMDEKADRQKLRKTQR